MKDGFGREITYLRLSITDRCNLRCRYCMPDEGVCKRRHDEMLTEDEMISAVEAAASLGITKLRVTGGEPLVKKNVLSICRRASAVEGIREVCLTTNATLLPELAKPLREAGVSRVNISIDTLDPEKYAYMTRRGTLADALKGIDAALEAGFDKIKLNAVLIGGFNDDEIRPIAELTRTLGADVRFIELMPMYDGGDFPPSSYIKADTVLEKLPEAVPENEADGVARLFRLPGAKGRLGLITPVSSHFCARCNRIRLTADGMIKPCLHSPAEICIKGLTRDEMAAKMREAVMSKPERHDELSYSERSGAARNMNRIGG